MTMTKPKEVTDAQFEGEVLKAETPVLVLVRTLSYGSAHR